MTKIKYIWALFLILILNNLIAQEKVSMKDVYVENDLVYKVSDEQLFTGIAQRIRKNGHLVYEESYNTGIIKESNLYYNSKERIISDKIIYNQKKLYSKEKEIRFHLSKDTLRIKTFDDNGKKKLVEEFENNHITYKCEYKGKKKHGLELRYKENGKKITYRCEYINGKKNGEELCINDNGTKSVKNYSNGKKIK
ncbi:hypothetical protein [Aquimarina sp. AU119]|uniref:hypothetical protein n=1 Tax=Aquimarina sp. AU119 TaxID=2108528 RepID=UPI000D691574|nr:hypothetical protein [Aquimarina sp. AU119]